MEDAASHRWFLRKQEDGTTFGPLSLEHLIHWASTAQVSPHDLVSTDQQTWMKAPMVPELGMDWLVELTSESYYGPTTLGSIQEFIHLGEIDHETLAINACDGSRHKIGALPLPEIASSDTEIGYANEPPPSGISVDLYDRIRELEQSLSEERRVLQETEERYAELERRYNELIQHAPESSL